MTMRTRVWSAEDKDRAADLVTGYVDGLGRALWEFDVVSKKNWTTCSWTSMLSDARRVVGTSIVVNYCQTPRTRLMAAARTVGDRGKKLGCDRTMKSRDDLSRNVRPIGALRLKSNVTKATRRS